MDQSRCRNRMDIIANMHTDLNSSKVLEAAIGSPANIYVAVSDGHGYLLCRSGVFAYYEFKQSMSDRLTDEQWQKIDVEKNRPSPPNWIRGLGYER